MANMKGKRGIDISYANGNIDLSKVKKAGYDFVMIRCGFGDNITSQDDNQFENNVKKAEKLGMPWGVYLYSYATNQKEAKSEVEHIKRLLKGKKPTMPVALDVEDSAHYSKHGCYNKTDLTAIVQTIMSGIKAAGFYPMIYTGKSWLENYIDKSVWSKYDIWLAAWVSSCTYSGSNLGMWQYGGETNIIESNSIPGIGVIDKNKCYKDYPTIIKNGGYNGWKKPTNDTKKVTKTTDKKSDTTFTITEARLRQKVANTINSWMGAVEGDNKHAEILNIYNSQKPLPVGYTMKIHDSWCAATVSATWIKVGIAKYTGTECSCSRFINVAKSKGIWVENDAYKPKIGDAIIYNWGDSGIGDNKSGASHIGIVTAVDGNKFTVTEGNTGSGNLGVVGKRTMSVNGTYIRGFIAPDYASIAKKVAGKVTPDKTEKKPSALAQSVATPTVKYRVRVDGKWLAEVKGLDDFAGKRGKAITDVAIKVSRGKVKYRVHIKGGQWLPYVTGYDTKNAKNGYAGNGKKIDAIEIIYTTPSDVAKANGCYKAKYHVSPKGKSYYTWQYDNEKTKGQDGYAGVFGAVIDRLQISLAK